jgi:hypothetical protein
MPTSCSTFGPTATTTLLSVQGRVPEATDSPSPSVVWPWLLLLYAQRRSSPTPRPQGIRQYVRLSTSASTMSRWCLRPVAWRISLPRPRLMPGTTQCKAWSSLARTRLQVVRPKSSQANALALSTLTCHSRPLVKRSHIKKFSVYYCQSPSLVLMAIIHGFGDISASGTSSSSI